MISPYKKFQKKQGVDKCRHSLLLVTCDYPQKRKSVSSFLHRLSFSGTSLGGTEGRVMLEKEKEDRNPLENEAKQKLAEHNDAGLKVSHIIG